LKNELDAAGSKELRTDLKVSVALFDNNEKTLQFSGIEQDMVFFNGSNMVIIEGDSADSIDDLLAEKIAVEPDTTFYMFTNGFYNQENQDGVKFSMEKFEEMLKSIQSKSLSDQYQFISQTLDDWRGDNGLTDDVSVIGFKL
jgi:hypothetical protein